MKCNKLSVNFKKTSYIFFKSRQKKLGKSFSLSFGNQTLKQVNETKFLDVYIDWYIWQGNFTLAWWLSQRIANSCFIIIINYCPRCFSSCSLKIGKYTVMIQEYPIAIDHINCRTNLKQFTILYQGPKIWNSLPISITGLTRFFTFKRKIIEFINKMNPNWPSRKSTT